MDDLADTLNQALVDHEDYEKYFKDWDHQSRPVEQLARYLADRYSRKPEDVMEDAKRLQVNDPDTFAESIPVSYHACDPGVDHDFEFDFEGTLEELMARIDREEEILISKDAEEWDSIARMFRGDS